MDGWCFLDKAKGWVYTYDGWFVEPGMLTVCGSRRPVGTSASAAWSSVDGIAWRGI